MRIWTLATREASRHLRRLSVRVTVATAIALAVLIVSLNVQDYRTRCREYEELVRARAGETVDWNADGVEKALRALRPPRVGEIFVRGIEWKTPRYWDFGPEGLKEGAISASLSASGLDAESTGPFYDLESLIRILLGLLAITLGVHTVAGERADGTLGVLVCQPVGALALAAGKLAGAALTFSIAVGLILAAGLATIYGLAPDVLSAAIRDPVPMFSVVSIVHLLTLHAIGMTLGALIQSPGAALTAGISLWICSALVAPPLMTSAGALIPVVPRLEVEQDIADKYQTQRSADLRALGTTYRPYAMSRTYVRGVTPDWLRDRLEVEWKVLARKTRTILAECESTWFAAFVRRTRWMDLLGQFTPSTTYMLAAAAVSDTGTAFNLRLNTAVREYHTALNASLFDEPARLILTVPYDETTDWSSPGYNRIAPLDTHFAQFQPPERRPAARLVDSRWTMLNLVVYLAASFVVATLSFPRSVP